MTDLEIELSDALQLLLERFSAKCGKSNLTNRHDEKAWNKACAALTKAKAAKDKT